MTYEYAGNSGLPFSLEKPLLFHELSTVPPGTHGDEILEDLLNRRAVLSPLNLRGDEPWADPEKLPKRLKKRDVQIFPVDIAAGDDKYLFFTPCHPLHADFLPNARPAVAFDAHDLVQRATNPGFRPRDLEGYYKNVIDHVGVLLEDEDPDDPEAEPAPDYFSIETELHAVAEILTRNGAIPVKELIDLYNDLIFRGFDDKKRPQTKRPTYPRDLMVELDQIIQPSTESDTVLWLAEECNIEIDPGEEWVHAFQNINKYPYVPEQPPEVVIDALVPLNIGLFFRDGVGRWHPMPESVKQSTKQLELKMNPGSEIIYVSPSERHQKP